MANYTWRVSRLIEYRWELKVPDNAAELDKAVSAAATAWKEAYNKTTPGIPDDALMITAEDNIIVISFSIKEEV